MKLLYAVDSDDRGTGAADIRPAGVEEVGKIDNMRLSRGILNDRRAVRQNGGDDGVDGCPDGRTVEIDAAAVHAIRRHGLDAAPPDIDLGAQLFKRLHMQVDRTDAEITAAGKTDLSMPEASQHCARKVVRSAKSADQVERRLHIRYLRGIDFHFRSGNRPHPSADAL